MANSGTRRRRLRLAVTQSDLSKCDNKSLVMSSTLKSLGNVTVPGSQENEDCHHSGVVYQHRSNNAT